VTEIRSSATQYGLVAVSIHWIMAILLCAAIYFGFAAAGTKAEADKVALLQLHATAGICVLLLSLTRVTWWLFFDKKPESVPDSSKGRRAIAGTVHFLLIALPLLGAAIGTTIAIQSGAIPTLFFGASIPLPDFWESALRLPHGIVARVILVLVIIHIAGFLLGLVLKPKAQFKRIWFR